MRRDLPRISIDRVFPERVGVRVGVGVVAVAVVVVGSS